MRGSARRVGGLLVLLACCVPEVGAQSEVPVPRLERRVTDLTGTLSATEQDALVRETSNADNSASDTDPIVGDGIFANGFEN